MTISEPSRPALSLKSIVLQSLFVALLAALGVFLWTRSRPERLNRAPDQLYKISGGHVYMFAAQDMVAAIGIPPSIPLASHNAPRSPEEARMTLQEMPVQGGMMKRISTDDTRYQPYAANEFTVEDGKIYYAVEPRRKSEQAGRLGAIGMSGKVIGGVPGNQVIGYLGNFAPPASDLFLAPNTPAGPLKPGEKRLRIRTTPLPTVEVRYRQVPIQGGTPEDAVVLQPDTACLVGSHVFWIRAQPEESVQITQTAGGRQSGFRTEVAARSDLMLTSLKDGSTRSLFHGIPRGTSLTVGDAGVAWYQPSVYPNPPTLHYARVADGAVCSLGPISSEDRSMVGHFVEFGDRIYWTAFLKEDGQHAVLRSARLDGSDVREVCRQREGHPIEGMTLYPSRGALYCCLLEAPVIVREEAVRSQYLCRVHPERAEAMEVIRQLPKRTSRCQFSGDYLYYVLSEQERDLWDTITDDPAVGRQVDTLCRVSLR